jgi:two-component system response regulator HydG
MRKLTSVAKAADDLRSHVHFDAETGQIWLNENRMLLVHAEAQALLRKELIDTLGMERARGLLTRMGYASGVRDAELARKQSQSADDMEAFMTGPKLHTLEGIVRVTPIRLEMDRPRGAFYGEFLWEHSWEGQWHRHYFGVHHEPVCWTQIGYASGYTSAFMGRRILYKEVECVGAGDNNCRIVGKPIEEWEDADAQMRYYNPESIADQLIDLQTQVTHLRSSIGEKETLPQHMIGVSPGFRAAYGLLKQAADSQIPVLLLGETGVGKEVFARCLHEMSPRAGADFVAVNCAAIPQELVESELFGVEKGAYTGAQSARPGRFERADGGTLFLDEVGDLPLPAQAKLLRVLQEREIERLGDARPRKVDVRVVAATNADLAKLVKDGRFRLDLYYRLNAYQILIPPLRERKDDISPLSKAFLEKYATVHGKRCAASPTRPSARCSPTPGRATSASCRTSSSAPSSSRRTARASKPNTCSSPSATARRRNSGSTPTATWRAAGSRARSCASRCSTACSRSTRSNRCCWRRRWPRRAATSPARRACSASPARSSPTA